MKVDNYRGMTLTSVFAKLLERLVLDRLEPVLFERKILHSNQSYKKVSCADAIFATQEVIIIQIFEGRKSSVYVSMTCSRIFSTAG